MGLVEAVARPTRKAATRASSWRASLLRGRSGSLADLALARQIDFFAGLPEWEPLMGPQSNLRECQGRMAARKNLQTTTWENVSAMAQAALFLVQRGRGACAGSGSRGMLATRQK